MHVLTQTQSCAHTSSSPRLGWSLVVVPALSLVAGGQCRQPAGRSPHKRAWAVTAILRPARLPVGPKSPPVGPPVQSAPSLSVCSEREDGGGGWCSHLLAVMPHGAPFLGWQGLVPPSSQTAKKAESSFRWSSHPPLGQGPPSQHPPEDGPPF